MATLENIRKKGKLLAIVIGLALLAFILGDMINSGKALFGGQDLSIVSVNDEDINYQEYENMVTQTEEYYKIMQGAESLDEQVAQQIRSSVWEQVIREALLKETYDDLGIEISKEELSDMVIGNKIHPLVAQTFVNPETGMFDKQLVINILQNLEQDPQIMNLWIYIENYIKLDRKYNKYQALITKSLYVTSLEVEEDNIERKFTVNIELVGKTFNEITDTTIKATEAELEEYYESHLNMFKNKTETRDLSYIVFDIIPTSSDSLIAFDKAKQYVQEIKTSDDEQSVVNLKSSQPEVVKYYTLNELQNSVLDSLILTFKKDTVFGPYFEYGVYNVVKLVDIVESRPDTVSAKHILISPQNPKIGTIERAKIVADSLMEVLKNGGNFDMLCLQYSDDPGSKENGGLYEDFTEGSMVTEFNDYCFEKNIGEIGTVETDYGIHIIQVTEQKNKVPKYKLAFIRVEITPSQKTYDEMYSYAMSIRTEAINEEAFDKVIMDKKFVRREATDISQGTYTIPGLDNVRNIVYWAFGAKQGEVSTVFEMGNKYVIAMVKNINELGYLSLEKVKTQVENSVIQKKKVEKIYKEYFENQTVSDLDAFAAKIGTQKLSLPNVAFNAFQLATIGYEPIVIGTIQKMEKDKIYGPIKGANGAYFLKVVSVTEAQPLTPEDLGVQKMRMKAALQQRASYQVYTALKDAVVIIDRRAKF